jgi:hypothetical protein
MVKVLYALAALGSWWLATGLIFTEGLRLGRGYSSSWPVLTAVGLYLLMVTFIVQVARQ